MRHEGDHGVVSSPPPQAWTRVHAYFLWINAGCPKGRSEEFWAAAEAHYPEYLKMLDRVKTRAYELWILEGKPEGKALVHWRCAMRQLGLFEFC